MPIFGLAILSWPVMRMPFSSSTMPSPSFATLKSGGRLCTVVKVSSLPFRGSGTVSNSKKSFLPHFLHTMRYG